MTAAFANATEIITTTDAATIVVTPPASLAAGNMWLILLTWDADPGSTIGTPTGFTKIGSDFVGADDGWPHSVLFYKIAGASESNATITRTGGDNYHRVAYSIRITGDGTLSIDAVGTPITPTGEATVIDAPDITIAQDASLAVLHGASVGTPTFGTTMAAPTGATLRDSRVGNNVYPVAAFATQAVNAGAFAPGNWTWGASADLNTNRMAQTISIKDTVAGATDFEATGDLDAQAATIAGSALHGRVSTGALAAQAAAIAGAATVNRVATGALSAQAATVAGAALRGRVATGSLEAQDAAIDGDATVQSATFTATGDLQAQAALIAGTVTVNRMATGALFAQAAQIAGTASGAEEGLPDNPLYFPLLLPADSDLPGLPDFAASPRDRQVDQDFFALARMVGAQSYLDDVEQWMADQLGDGEELASLDAMEAFDMDDTLSGTRRQRTVRERRA